MESTLKVLAKYLKTVFNEFNFAFNLHNFLLPSIALANPSPGKLFTPYQADQLPKLFPPLDTSTTALVCSSLFLDSEP